eukprot:TRINITY_DN185_c0_g1_i13.p1 TRINITY_DN185_c0_g1~~TRINITY_DN185_c0_g1_i13.p1  ORF type:complete len:902 (+),score=130.16 TRINITY_DN185_c0_g1_i13:4016-6721(+)
MVQCRGAGGTNIPCCGSVQVELQIASNIRLLTTAMVCEIQHEFMVGWQAMRQLRAKVDAENGRVEFAGGVQAVTRALKTTRLLQLPSQTMVSTTVKYHVPGDRWNETALIQNSPDSDLTLVPAVIDTHREGRCIVHLANFTDHVVTVKEGAIVGMVLFNSVDGVEEASIAEVNHVEPGGSQRSGPPPPEAEEIIARLVEETPLEKQEKEELRELLREYWEVLYIPGIPAAPNTEFEHSIITGDAKPIHIRARRTNPVKQQVIDALVNQLLQDGLIKRSKSPWAAPVVLALKKDGTYRLCIDYRGLNAVTVPDSFPMPLVDDVLSRMHGCKFFSTLDLASGFHQFAVRPQDCKKTAFVTASGLYEFAVLPFGLINGPATCQRAMNSVLADVQHLSACFMDDVNIYTGGGFREHFNGLEAVFSRTRNARLRFKSSKIHLFQREAKVLSHVVNEDGIATDPRMVADVLECAPPADVKQVRQFVGMCQYYRKFVRNFSQIAKPLTDLTGKYARFEWGESQQQAFQMLKDLMLTAPILSHPDFTRPFVLVTDASEAGVGAWLGQWNEGHDRVMPVGFASQLMSKTQRRWDATHREAYGVIFGLKKFATYLEVGRFEIFTDHRALVFLLDLRKQLEPQTQRMANWQLKLQQFQYDIKYLPGHENVVADWLSRAPRTAGHGGQQAVVAAAVEREDSMSEASDDTAGSETWSVGSEHEQSDEEELIAPEMEPELDDSEMEPELDESEMESAGSDEEIEKDAAEMSATEQAHKLLSRWNIEEEQHKWLPHSSYSDVVAQLKEQRLTKRGTQQADGFAIKENVLYRVVKPKGKAGVKAGHAVVVPPVMREAVMQVYHDDVTSGHFGWWKTWSAMATKVWWPNLSNDEVQMHAESRQVATNQCDEAVPDCIH